MIKDFSARRIGALAPRRAWQGRHCHDAVREQRVNGDLWGWSEPRWRRAVAPPCKPCAYPRDTRADCARDLHHDAEASRRRGIYGRTTCPTTRKAAPRRALAGKSRQPITCRRDTAVTDRRELGVPVAATRTCNRRMVHSRNACDALAERVPGDPAMSAVCAATLDLRRCPAMFRVFHGTAGPRIGNKVSRCRATRHAQRFAPYPGRGG